MENNLNKKDYDEQVNLNENKVQHEQKKSKLTALLIIFDVACVLFTVLSNLIQGYNIFYILFTLLTILFAIAALITSIYTLSKGKNKVGKAGRILSITSIVVIAGILSFTIFIGGLYIAILMFM